NLYIADQYDNVIRRVSSSGVITTVAGVAGTEDYSGDGGPASSAELDWPQGMAVDGAGNLYFADSFNGRVRRIDPAGVITTVAGDGSWGFGGDGGPAVAAQLNYPTD